MAKFRDCQFKDVSETWLRNKQAQITGIIIVASLLHSEGDHNLIIFTTEVSVFFKRSIYILDHSVNALVLDFLAVKMNAA